MNKYDLLVNVLDNLRSEAPESYKTYHKSDTPENIQKGRSLALIHLFLKVKFGVNDFLERHELITDGTFDGGIDAYFIDQDNLKIHIIQSKCRNNEESFNSKPVNAEELVKIELGRIIKGDEISLDGNKYNDKIIHFQKKLREIRDIARYDYIIDIIGNVRNYRDEIIRRLLDNSMYEIYNSDKIYNDLLFPISKSTYFDPKEIIIKLDLDNKDQTKYKTKIETDFGEYFITVLFVPTFEIGKILNKYKNSILVYNPRNYLSLSNNAVNQQIRSSIMTQSKNNFALLNNGITIISDNVQTSDSVGEKNIGQLILTRPQIINGGQSAYVLSEIYDEAPNKANSPLSQKEVLLKIITPIDGKKEINQNFIQLISTSTNSQSEVDEADQRSNHSIQINLEKLIFENFGYFYERKKGQYYEALNKGIIPKERIINRLDFIKSVHFYQGNPSNARRSSEKLLFSVDKFISIVGNIDNYMEMFFSFLIFKKLNEIESKFKKIKESQEKYGNCFTYGKYALIAAIGCKKEHIPSTYKDMNDLVDLLVADRLEKWNAFEKFTSEKLSNSKYFSKGKRNFDLYYKISSLDIDIKEFFMK